MRPRVPKADLRDAKLKVRLRPSDWPARSEPLNPDRDRLDVERQDGLAPVKRVRDVAIVPADKPKRGYRRAVSTSKGSVPAIVASARDLPPTGAGSTRSYGIRALRA
jgi:hypothetical protein